MTLQWKFESFQASRSKNIVEIAKIWPKHGPDMAQAWALYGPNILTLNGFLLLGLPDSLVKI